MIGRDTVAQVSTILRATRTGDLNLLSNTLRGLHDFEGITVWWLEALTGKWDVFTEKDSWECHTNAALMDRVANSAELVAGGVKPSVAAFLAFTSTCKAMSR